MATKSVRENILDALKATLEAIQAGATYKTSVKKVYIYRVAGLQISEYPSIIVFPTGESYDLTPFNKLDHTWNIALECWLTEYQGISIVEKVNQFLADIEKALMADNAGGADCIKIDLISNEPFYNDENKPYGGVTVNIAVNFRHNYQNPYEV